MAYWLEKLTHQSQYAHYSEDCRPLQSVKDLSQFPPNKLRKLNILSGACNRQAVGPRKNWKPAML